MPAMSLLMCYQIMTLQWDPLFAPPSSVLDSSNNHNRNRNQSRKMKQGTTILLGVIAVVLCVAILLSSHHVSASSSSSSMSSSPPSSSSSSSIFSSPTTWLALFGGFLVFVHFRLSDKVGQSPEDFGALVEAPTSISNDNNNDNNKLDSQSGNRAVVVLGWGGAQRRHLRKLLDWYRQQGIHTISFTASLLAFLHQPVHRPSILTILSTLLNLSEQSAQPFKWHVHVHSNTGAQSWAVLLHELRTAEGGKYKGLENLLQGIIYDSAPSLTKRMAGPAPTTVVGDDDGDGGDGGQPSSVSRPAQRMSLLEVFGMSIGLTFPLVPIVLRRAQYIHWFWTPAAFVYFLAVLLVRWVLALRTDMYHFGHLLWRGPRKVPVLFVFGTGDKLIPPHRVESFMKDQEGYLQAPITAKKFDSAHVLHFKSYPEEYGKEIIRFLGLSTQSQSQSQSPSEPSVDEQ